VTALPTRAGAEDRGPGARGAPRHAWADNLKTTLVAGVIVAHATMAWTGVGNWVFTEPPVREPLLSVLVLLSVVGALFGMPLFFLVAGIFTPASLERKGARRFLQDRYVRLGVPLVFFVVFLAPVVEWVDPENAGWDHGFPAFAWTVVWWSWPLPPAWGPTWFLAVLLVFSTVYAMLRRLRPRPVRGGGPRLRARRLLVVAAATAVASFAIRIWAPLGEEPFRLALGQAPAWVTGFALGVAGAERGWIAPLEPRLVRWARRVAWATTACFALIIGLSGALGVSIDAFTGAGTWQSLVLAALEGVLVVSMPLWLLDLFRRRADVRRPILRRAGRAAFAAFVLHQLVLVALVLATHRLPWPPEAEYLLVGALGVLGSFGLAALLLRVPGVSRVV
jgi:fucose 4-O-acetylase-like acetyltransferase